MGNLIAFNKAMLAKQIWRILSFPNSFVSQTFRCKYFCNSSVLEAKLSVPSFLWRSFVASIPLFKEGMFWNAGNVQYTKIWSKKWLSIPSN